MKYLEENKLRQFVIDGSVADPIKLGFTRFVFVLAAGYFILLTLITSVLKFTPLARFYINENEWLLHFLLILTALTFITLLLKMDEENTNCLLFLIHILLQMAFAAVAVTFYDSLWLLEGEFLTACAISFLLLYSLLLKRSNALWIDLCLSILVIFTLTTILQAVFGFTNEELLKSSIFSTCISIYLRYITHLVLLSMPCEKYFSSAIIVYLWPLIIVKLLTLN